MPLKDEVQERAPAKINLALAVTGRRADGYHLLDTLAVFADIGDTVIAAHADDFSLVLDGPFAARLDTGQTNLVIRAARLLADAARFGGREVPGARIHLKKTLPVAAGLGGGSADAAATLRALDRLWSLDYGPQRLADIGAVLGADIAMCAHSRALRARGIGEEITLLEAVPPLPMVLANPGTGVATRDVFARGPAFSSHLPEPTGFADPAALAEWLADLGNDLQSPASNLAPVIDDVLSALQLTRGCLLARMSGSGATCFAIFPDRAAASSAADELSAARPDWWVRATTAR